MTPSSRTRRVRAALVVLIVQLPLAAAAFAGPPVAPRPLADLRDFVARAVKAGAARAVIPPGVYRGEPADGEKVHLALRGARNLEIVATGVTMVCTRRTRAIDFAGCREVTLTGLTIDYDPLTFTQGAVVAVAADESWVDVRVDAGYPRQAWSRIDVVDPATRFRKKGMPFLWGTRAEMVGEDVVRVTLKGIGKAAKVGDLASLSAGPEAGGIAHGVTLTNCGGGMVLRGVTLHAAPGMGIVEDGGAGGTVLEGVRIVVGPPPAGGTAARLLTTSWDGILHSNVGRGPRVERCVIEHCGDDSWSVQSQDTLVLRRTGAEVILAPRGDQRLANGDELWRWLDGPRFGVGDVRAIRAADAGLSPDVAGKLRDARPWSFWKVDGRMVRATLAGGVADGDGPREGESLYSPSRQGNGFVFRENRVHSSGRILIKAGGGVVERNLLDSPHGLVVCPEVPDGAAAGIANLVIRRNRIVESGYFCPAWESAQAGAISVVSTATEGGRRTFRAAGAFANVTIEENWLEGVCGLNVLLTSTRGGVVRNNRFVRTHGSAVPLTGGAYGVEQGAVIDVRRCEGVVIEGNVFEGVGALATKKVRVDGESRDVRDGAGR